VPGPEEPRQRDRYGGKPNEHPGGHYPWRGSRRHRNQAPNGDGQPDVSHSKGPDSHPPVAVVMQQRSLVHAKEYPTVIHDRVGKLASMARNTVANS
jgi:hypothetical protein